MRLPLILREDTRRVFNRPGTGSERVEPRHGDDIIEARLHGRGTMTQSIKDDLQLFAEAGARLKAAGVLRTNSLVGDVGEWVAARYYGVKLANTVTRGFDLITADGRRVQVKTLRDGNDGRRTEAGRVLGPCDLLLIVRLAPDYTPLGAIEVDLQVVQEVFGAGPVRWSRRFAADPRVRTIPGSALSV